MSKEQRVDEDYRIMGSVDCVWYDERGSITQYGKMARGIVWDEQAKGTRIVIGSGNDTDNYVDTTGSTPAVKQRPELPLRFDSTNIFVKQEATIKGLPPAKVSFTGPIVGTQEHKTAGDLSIGWTTPGEYMVTIEAFPAKPISFPFVVKKRVLL